MLVECSQCGKTYLRLSWGWKHIDNKCPNGTMREVEPEISKLDFALMEIKMLKRLINGLKTQKVGIVQHDIDIRRVKNTNRKYTDERALEMQKCFKEFAETIKDGSFKLTPVPKDQLHHIYNFSAVEQTMEVI